MGCWKWFDGLLREAGLEVTLENMDNINRIIHQYVGRQANYGRCSPEWEKVGKELQTSPQTKDEIVKALRLLYLEGIRYKGY